MKRRRKKKRRKRRRVNTNRQRGFVVALLILRAIFASPAVGLQSALPQSYDLKKDYALIYGTVWGPDDHPVAGVPIKIRRSSDKKPKWELVSDRNGEFAQRVPIGTQDYIVEADIKTPKGQLKPQATAHIDNNERTDISLHLTKENIPPR
jgi:hypothetical protein